MTEDLRLETPYLLVDLEKVRDQCRILKEVMGNTDVYYAIKANPAKRIIQTVVDEHCGLEVSSEFELRQAIEIGVPASRIISSNPIKKPTFLSALHEYGVDRLAFDSKVEVDKIRQYAPNSRVYLRLQTDNTGSEWPLARKFGASATEAVSLLNYAAEQGLTPYGLTFHVGSQCLNADNWEKALSLCSDIIEQVGDLLPLEMINLGGGIPIRHIKPIPQIAQIAHTISRARKLFSDRISYQIEPGRFLVGEAATLITSVVGKAQRGNESWLYLDVGVFNGLMETVAHFSYDFDFDVGPERERKVFTIAGPTCDSLDVMFVDCLIPDLQIGERLYINHAGAYTTAYASNFNGFEPPTVIYKEDVLLEDKSNGDSTGRSSFKGAGRLPLECPADTYAALESINRGALRVEGGH